MQDVLRFFSAWKTPVDAVLGWNTGMTVLLVIVVVALRFFLAARVEAAAIKSPELRRRWLVSVRNGCFLLLLIGLTAIWSQEIQQVAISLLAIVVALVLATKELILCLTGSILKVRSGSFSVGDRIVVNGTMGDVVDQTLLTTRLAELAPVGSAHQYTGRTITLPNSLFLIHPVTNCSVLEEYVLHTIVVPLTRETDWMSAETLLLQSATDVSSSYMEQAQSRFGQIARRHGLEVTEIEPRISISLPDPLRVDLLLRLVAPTGQARRVEQEILHDFMAKMSAKDVTRNPV